MQSVGQYNKVQMESLYREYIMEPIKANIPTSTPCAANAIIMISNFQMRKTRKTLRNTHGK